VTGADRLAGRTVTAVVAGMVVATAAATVVGFWLSYKGLHDFAARAGLTGPEAWAWPASVDLFIAAGEAGVTISALRRRRDPMAWAYLALGFAASVTGNVLHVDTGHLAWARYAVAAVPPMAAMLALAALLRHVYRIALDRHTAPAVHPGRALTTVPVPHPESAPGSNGQAHPERTRDRSPARTPGAPGPRTRGAPVTAEDAEREFMADLAAGAVPSVRQVRARLHVGQDRAKVLRDHLASLTSGSAP